MVMGVHGQMSGAMEHQIQVVEVVGVHQHMEMDVMVDQEVQVSLLYDIGEFQLHHQLLNY